MQRSLAEPRASAVELGARTAGMDALTATNSLLPFRGGLRYEPCACTHGEESLVTFKNWGCRYPALECMGLVFNIHSQHGLTTELLATLQVVFKLITLKNAVAGFASTGLLTVVGEAHRQRAVLCGWEL